jgi:hypothetical protein
MTDTSIGAAGKQRGLPNGNGQGDGGQCRRLAQCLALGMLALAGTVGGPAFSQNGPAFSGTGRIVAVPGRKVENPSLFFLETTFGRTLLLSCGRGDYTRFLGRRVEIAGSWYQTAGICVDSVTAAD